MSLSDHDLWNWYGAVPVTVAGPAEEATGATYTVPVGFTLAITDIKVNTSTAGWFFMNTTVLGHIWSCVLGGAGVLSQSYETPIILLAGQIFSVRHLVGVGSNVAAEVQGELIHA